MNLNNEEIEIITRALLEYENAHYQSENTDWQIIINNLFIKLKEVQE